MAYLEDRIMTYKIIGDSCLDLTRELKQDPVFQTIPLTLQVGEVQIADDESFDQQAFIKMVKECPECPQTACPSPELFLQAYKTAGTDVIYVITLSSHLSGSWNSARVAADMFQEEGHTTPVYVIDSHSASSGELNIALKVRELCEQGLLPQEIYDKAMEYRDKMNTYFVLESLDTLRKNGRLSGLQAFFATALNIKPVMGEKDGVIIKLDQARGMNRALQRMCETAVKEAAAPEDMRVVICHVNHPKRAQQVKEELEKLALFKEIIITKAAGVATVYANDGGIVIAM